MTKIKICGLSREEDIICVNALCPEYIGFVFAEKSRRFVTAEKALALRELLDRKITPAGVFVDASPELAARIADRGAIDVIQLHGNEDNAYIAKLRTLTNVPVIKAFRIRSSEDIQAAESSQADYVLLDSGCGTGITFDWSLIGDIKRPYFLAGGLDCDNVADAVKNLSPYAVDVSSSMETDGVKDPQKIKDFIQKVKGSCP